MIFHCLICTSSGINIIIIIIIIIICAEARELGQYESLANPVVSGVMIDKLPLSELRDYDSYRMEGQGHRFA